MNDITVIGNLGRYTIATIADETIEPGHQCIAIAPSDNEGAAILFAITGNPDLMWKRKDFQVHANGTTFLMAPHDLQADRRLISLVDLCASLRYAAPQLVQLQLTMEDQN